MGLVVDVAMKYIGYPSMKYQSPNIGNNPSAFDCSGFIQWVLNETGIVIPNIPGFNRKVRHSEEFFDYFGILIHEEFIKEGDLIFFSRNGSRPTHIGFYLSTRQIIHSPGINGSFVEVKNLDDYLQERPLVFDPRTEYEQIYYRNPIGFKRIAQQTKDRFQRITK
ncbi:C40 family peptidase [Candidatus Woesearchaeota archaeon]|nr:C40 family peptidase [Candidatus Woesearchaeota archaeon]